MARKRRGFSLILGRAPAGDERLRDEFVAPVSFGSCHPLTTPSLLT